MPRQEAAGAAAVVHLCKLFVGGVPQAMGEGELEGIFAQHAQVQRVWLQRHRSEKQDKQHRGFGYVVYRDPGAVDRLLGDRPSRFLQPSSGVRLEVKRALSCREIQNGALRGPAAPPPPEACAAPSRPEPLFASWPPRQGGMGPRCFAPRGGWCPAGPVWPGAGAAPPEPEPLLGRWPPQQGGAGWGPAGPCQQHPAAALAPRACRPVAGGARDALAPEVPCSPQPGPLAQQWEPAGRGDASLGSLHEAALLRFRLGEPEPDSDEELVPCHVGRWVQMQ